MTPTHGVALLAAGLCLSGCVSLHHVQIGELDNTQGPGTPVDVKTSATGVNLEEAADLAKGVTRSRTMDKTADTVSTVWKLITYGPRTGEVTFSADYADRALTQAHAQCPSGRLTGVTAIRETNKYPIVSGEIVRVVAFCVSDTATAGKTRP